MKDWIPLLQSLVWPLFVTLVVLQFKAQLKRIFSEVTERIRKGDTLEASATGLKLSRAGPEIDDSTVTNPESWENPTDQFLEEELKRAVSPSEIYVTHTAKRAPDLDKKGYAFYRLRIWVDSDDRTNLDPIESVTYLLHPTFKNPTRTIRDRRTLFELNTAAWGEFELKALVRFKDGRRPLELKHYITLEPSD
jgi:hypothetical protein